MCVGEKSRIVVVSEFDYGLTELKNLERCGVSNHCLDKNSLKMFGYRGVTQLSLPLDRSGLDKDIIIPGGSTLYYDIELVKAYYPLIERSPYVQVPPVYFLHSLEEFEQSFKSMDIDGDSVLSREEVSAFYKKLHRYSEKRVDDFFISEDKDKDGYISLEEFLGFPQHHPKHEEL